MTRRRYGLTKSYYDINDTAQDDAIKAQTERFTAALAQAIRQRTESAPIGTFIDHSPPPARMRKVRALAERSYSGSQAHMCADNGEY